VGSSVSEQLSRIDELSQALQSKTWSNSACGNLPLLPKEDATGPAPILKGTGRRSLKGLVPTVSRRARIVARRHGVGIPPLSVPALNANLPAAEIADGFFGLTFSLSLRVMDTAGSFRARFLHSPSVIVFDDIPFILRHGILLWVSMSYAI